ncbi:hypothetical protein [Thermocladium modestius]|nr:hypothetical protein [Thermocladium modestius]
MADLLRVLENASQLRLEIEGDAIKAIEGQTSELASEACAGVDNEDCKGLLEEALKKAARGPLDSNYWRYIAYIELMLAPNPTEAQSLLRMWSSLIEAAFRRNCHAAAELGRIAAASMTIAMNIYMAAFSELVGANWELLNSIVKSAIGQLMT